jgi:pimeloyl-ACP methyl ester carboxylesterase
MESNVKSEGAARNHVLCGYANITAGQIHYRATAGCDPAVVFLHQTASASSSFQPVMERIDLPNRLIALDTPGFGGSYDPEGWPSMGDYADHMLEALDQLGVQSFHLFGQHTGAALALEIAARRQAEAKSVMMLGPVCFSPDELAAFRTEYEQPFSPKPDGSHFLQNWRYAFDNNPGCDLELLTREVINMVRAWKARPQAYRAVSYQDALALTRDAKVPLLLMISPGDWFYSRFQRVCDLRPDAAVVIVGGDNFEAQRDSANVAKAITDFVRSQSRRAPA